MSQSPLATTNMDENDNTESNGIADEGAQLAKSEDRQHTSGSPSNSSATASRNHAGRTIHSPSINTLQAYECPDLDPVIYHQRNLLLRFPTGSMERARWLASLGMLFQQRFERLGKLLDIGQAVNYHTQAVSHTHDTQPEKHLRLGNLSTSILQRYLSRRPECNLADLELAIARQIDALRIMPLGHAHESKHLCFLGKLLIHRFNHSNELADLDDAIIHQGKAVSLAPRSQKDIVVLFTTLSESYACRFGHTSQPQDLDLAIELIDKSLSLTPDNDGHKPQYLKTMGNLLQRRYKQQGDSVDSDRAVEFHTQALLLTKTLSKETMGWLSELGHSTRRRFEQTGDLSDLERAISYQSKILSLMPEDHIDRARHLENMANSLRQRFQRLGELEDVDNAIACHGQAVSLTRDGHTSMPRLLDALGESLRRRFERVGSLSDIDQAIAHQTHALEKTCVDHADMPRRLDNRGNSLLQRYLWLGEHKDLNSAIDSQTQALKLTPDGHAHRPSRLSNLGGSLQCRFEHFADLEDNRLAIEYQEESAHLTPAGHIELPRRLDGLGNSFRHRFISLGKEQDIEQAIHYHQKAVCLTPHDHPEMPWFLASLSNSHIYQFQGSGELQIIDMAIEYQSQAVGFLPETHSGRSQQLYDLGNAWVLRYERSLEHNDLNNGITKLREAAGLAGGSPSIRFKSARTWAKIASLHRQTSTLEAYTVVMSLLPRVIWLGSPIKHRQHSLSLASDIAVEAAAAAISFERYDLSIEWLEEGSSVLWRQVLQLRTPLVELSAIAPELAHRLGHVAGQLERASEDSSAPLSLEVSYLEQVSQRHRRLAEEWEHIVEEVRRIPQFCDFLQPKPAGELLRAAHSGAVVILNIHSTRCDALIIPHNVGAVNHLALPDFSYEDAVNMQESLVSFLGWMGTLRGVRKVMPIANGPFSASMAQLWTCVVQPVLQYLGYTRISPVDQLPHITWRTTGPLTSFPIHAAGLYEMPGEEAKIYNYAVSSYTPTLAALLTVAPSSDNFQGILAVGQQSTPGLSYLPGTIDELQAISEHFQNHRQTHLKGHIATPAAVLEEMQKHSWVHLACHASQNLESPMHSAFYLHDGRLDVSQVAKISLKHAGLAFLSACQTATGDKSLPEEAVHLASGMIIAGYPTVIASLWSIMDNDAPIIADALYQDVLAEGKPDIRRAAKALHKAVGNLRDRVGEMEFPQWAPYVHIGL